MFTVYFKTGKCIKWLFGISIGMGTMGNAHLFGSTQTTLTSHNSCGLPVKHPYPNPSPETSLDVRINPDIETKLYSSGICCVLVDVVHKCEPDFVFNRGNEPGGQTLLA